MTTLPEARHIRISLQRPAEEVYRFVRNPENLPRWASGLGASIRNIDGRWVAESPMGNVEIRFAKENELGVLDHEVVMDSGETFHNPMRVVPNGAGSELSFVLFRQPGMSDEKFDEDTRWIEKDLRALKHFLET